MRDSLCKIAWLRLDFLTLTLTNSADPNEIQRFLALHLGLHCLSKYSFRSQWFNIHVQVSIVAQNGRVSRKALSGKIKLNLLGWFIRYTFVNSRGLYYSVFFLGYYLVNRKIPCKTLLIPTYPCIVSAQQVTTRQQ